MLTLFASIFPYLGIYYNGLKPIAHVLIAVSAIMQFYRFGRCEFSKRYLLLYFSLPIIFFATVYLTDDVLLVAASVLYLLVHVFLIQVGEKIIFTSSQISVVIKSTSIVLGLLVVLSIADISLLSDLNKTLTGQSRGVGLSRGSSFLAPEPGLSSVGIFIYLLFVRKFSDVIRYPILYSLIGVVSIIMTDSGSGYLLLSVYVYFILLDYVGFEFNRIAVSIMVFFVMAILLIMLVNYVEIGWISGGIDRFLKLPEYLVNIQSVGENSDSVAIRLLQLSDLAACMQFISSCQLRDGFSIGIAQPIVGVGMFALPYIFIAGKKIIFSRMVIPYVIIIILHPLVSPMFFLLSYLAKTNAHR